MTRHVAGFVVAVILLGLGAGAGEAGTLSKVDYEQKVQSLYADVQQAFQGTRGVSGRELAERIAAARKALRHAADELSRSDVPEDVRAENRELTEGMRAYARDLERAARAAARGDDATMAPFRNASTLPGVRQMAEAAERMKEKGYRLGAIAKD